MKCFIMANARDFEPMAAIFLQFWHDFEISCPRAGAGPMWSAVLSIVVLQLLTIFSRDTQSCSLTHSEVFPKHFYNFSSEISQNIFKDNRTRGVKFVDLEQKARTRSYLQAVPPVQKNNGEPCCASCHPSIRTHIGGQYRRYRRT